MAESETSGAMEQYTDNLKKLNRCRAGYKSKITRIQKFLVEKAETSDDVELRSRLGGMEEMALNIENLKLEYYALLKDDDLDEHQLQFDAIEEQLEDIRVPLPPPLKCGDYLFMGRRTFLQKEQHQPSLEELKEKISTEWHSIPLDELVDKLGTNLEKGLTFCHVEHVLSRDG
ncbi:unnamed protein product, partial [Larinioides sclopetarius]